MHHFNAKQYEPPHDKTNKMTMRPAKIQISLGIRPVWSETSLCAQRVAKDPSFLHADSEDWSDREDAQADVSLPWAHSHFVGFVMRWLISAEMWIFQCRGKMILCCVDNAQKKTLLECWFQ